MQYAAFISYSKKDRPKARRLHAALEKAGLRCWMDDSQIQVGDELTPAIKQAISDSACFVVLLSQHSNVSDWVRKECQFALELQKRRYIIAIGGTEPSDQFDEQFRDLVRIDAGQRLTGGAKARIIADVWASHRNRIPVVSVLNMKGGVGKTTLSYHLFGCMHDRRKVSTLLVDLDPQHNLSQLMVPLPQMEQAWSLGKSVMSMFEPSQVQGFPPPDIDLQNFSFSGELAIPDQITIPVKPRHPRRPRLDLLLGHFEIIKYSLTSAAPHREALIKNFKGFIEAAKKHYGLVVIDLNPGASFLTELALSVSTHILAPVRPDRYSRRGLVLLDRLIDKAFRLSAAPQRIALVNGYHRSGNQALLEGENEVIADIATSWPRVLESKIGISDLLQARPRPAREDNDLTYWMAHKSFHPGGIAIRRELEKAADELARELEVA